MDWPISGWAAHAFRTTHTHTHTHTHTLQPYRSRSWEASCRPDSVQSHTLAYGTSPWDETENRAHMTGSKTMLACYLCIKHNIHTNTSCKNCHKNGLDWDEKCHTSMGIMTCGGRPAHAAKMRGRRILHSERDATFHSTYFWHWPLFCGHRTQMGRRQWLSMDTFTIKFPF